MPELWHLLFYLLRLIQNYAAIGIWGEKVAASVADGKRMVIRMQYLQRSRCFEKEVRISLCTPYTMNSCNNLGVIVKSLYPEKEN